MLIKGLQNIFDHVVKNLHKQNKRSMTLISFALFGDKTSCAYRGDGGCKCAAGWLIPDEDYIPFMEGRSVNRLKFFEKNYKEDELCLISSLQLIHDDVPVEEWKDYWKDTAKDYNLIMPELEAVA